MPCNDDGPPLYLTEYAEKISTLEAALCAVLRSAESLGQLDAVMIAIDAKEAGIDPWWIRQWFVEHSEKDRRRREVEKAHRAQAKKREAALAKLSDEEKHLLGLG